MARFFGYPDFDAYCEGLRTLGPAIMDRVKGKVKGEMSEFDKTKVICPNCVHQFRAVPVDVQLEGIRQRQEIERLQIALGQANADLMGCRDGALVRDLRSELDRLKYELAIIGDMAVSDWNEAVVARVDAVVPEAPPTYGERRRAKLAEYQRMRTEIAELKAKLAQAEVRGIEIAIKAAANVVYPGVKHYLVQTQPPKTILDVVIEAIRAEITKLKSDEVSR